MNVLRGTFRLSIFIGLAVTAYFAWQAFVKSHEAYKQSFELWSTLRCGRHLLDKDTKSLENEYGNIDLGKVGCIDRQFWANKHEIQEAWAQANPNMEQRDWMLRYGLRDAWISGLIAMVLTNLLGLVFLGVRRAYRWVIAGYGS
jgi:hypothetical protein